MARSHRAFDEPDDDVADDGDGCQHLVGQSLAEPELRRAHADDHHLGDRTTGKVMGFRPPSRLVSVGGPLAAGSSAQSTESAPPLNLFSV